MRPEVPPHADYSDHTHATPAASVSQTNGIWRNEARFGFKATDFVVYPAHGVGQIIAIEEQTEAGASLEFFVVYFAKSKMTLRAPTRKAANVGMRKLSDRAAIQGVRRTLSQAPHKARGNWSRLAQEYEGKINSGGIIATVRNAPTDQEAGGDPLVKYEIPVCPHCGGTMRRVDVVPRACGRDHPFRCDTS